jgi:hypothetical protein
LGLTEHIPAGWIDSGSEGLFFRFLSVREAYKLVLVVDDAANSYRAPSPRAGPNQLPLF